MRLFYPTQWEMPHTHLAQHLVSGHRKISISFSLSIRGCKCSNPAWLFSILSNFDACRLIDTCGDASQTCGTPIGIGKRHEFDFPLLIGNLVDQSGLHRKNWPTKRNAFFGSRINEHGRNFEIRIVQLIVFFVGGPFRQVDRPVEVFGREVRRRSVALEASAPPCPKCQLLRLRSTKHA